MVLSLTLEQDGFVAILTYLVVISDVTHKRDRPIRARSDQTRSQNVTAVLRQLKFVPANVLLIISAS